MAKFWLTGYKQKGMCNFQEMFLKGKCAIFGSFLLPADQNADVMAGLKQPSGNTRCKPSAKDGEAVR